MALKNIGKFTLIAVALFCLYMLIGNTSHTLQGKWKVENIIGKSNNALGFQKVFSKGTILEFEDSSLNIEGFNIVYRWSDTDTITLGSPKDPVKIFFEIIPKPGDSQTLILQNPAIQLSLKKINP